MKTSNTPRSTPLPAPDRRKVLTKAVVRAARAPELSQPRVAAALGVSDPTASRMFAEKYLLDPGRKEWEPGALFVRLFRSLDSIVASGEKARARLGGGRREPARVGRAGRERGVGRRGARVAARREPGARRAARRPARGCRGHGACPPLPGQ